MGNDSNKNTKKLIHLYLLDKKIKHHKEIPKMKSEKIYFIQKNIVDRYKELCHYEEIIDFFENKITKTELNENNISDIIEQIPKETIYKFENINEDYLLNEMAKENNNQWKYKSLKIANNKNINYIDDFEIIDKDLKEFFKDKKFKVLKGKYVIGNKGIFIYIKCEKKKEKKTEFIFELGNFDKNGTFNIEYLLDKNEIANPDYFLNALFDVGIDSIFNQILKQEKTDIKFKISLLSYPYNLYIFNDINKDNISNYTINNTTLYESSIYKSTASIEANPIDIKNQINDFSSKLNIKLKCLIKISIVQKIIKKTNTKVQKVFLLNTKNLDQFYFNEVEELINKNEKIKKIIDDKNINDLSLDLIIANLLNDNQFKEINNKISSINIPFTSQIYEGEDFNLHNNKKIKIFKSFIIINEDLSKEIEKLFGIRLIKEYLLYISIKKKKIDIDRLIISDNQYTIFIWKLNYDCHIYNIDYILNFESSENLKDEFKDLFNKGHSNYLFEKNIFDKCGKKKDIFPIFSKKDNPELIGYGYKYKDKDPLNIDNTNAIDYSKCLSNEMLTNTLSLFSNYENIKTKISESFEKYYLINSEFMNNIKIEHNYKLLKDALDENIKKVKILNDNKRNIYSLLKILPIEFLENYLSLEYNYNKNKIQINTNVEPLKITINYFDNIIKKQNSLVIYNDFEIIEKKVMKLFIENIETYENKDMFCECFFVKGKIIINMKNNLNNKIISLIGSLDNYYNYFTLEYIFIYNNDKDRISHFKFILGKLDKYLKKLQLCKNNAPITLGENSDIIGTVIKYGEDYDNNISMDDNNINGNKNTLKNNFKSSPHVGLQNIGATCYMNSTLQCFCHIEKFVEFFKYDPQTTNIIKNEKDKLSSSFKILIDNLWPNNFDPSSPEFKKYYSPDEFKNKISKMNPLFEGVQANDAKDLVNFIIMTLHLELNKSTKVNENQVDEIIDQTNKELIKKIFNEDFDKKNNSIISELFYATNYNTTKCLNCNTFIYNFQTYFFINFPLEEVRKYKIEIMNNQQNNNNFQNQFNNLMINPFNIFNMFQQNQFMMNQQIQMNNNINEVNIFDCFDYDEKVNYMTGQNQMFCNYCRSNCDSYMKTNLYTGPEVLILILNRGKGIEFDVKIYFTEELNLSKYIENKESGYMYNLIGVITHLGESSMSGHFIAYCKDPLNGRWYKYNDAIVDEVNDFKKEVIDFAMPYLLFYQKDKNP